MNPTYPSTVGSSPSLAQPTNGTAAKPIQAIARLRAIADLKENWDGYGAAAIESTAIEHTLTFIQSLALFEVGCRLLPKAVVFPTRNGGVQVEWHHDSRHIEIEIESDGRAEYLYFDRSTGNVVEGTYQIGNEVDPGFLEVAEKLWVASDDQGKLN